jgi:hypothetical protein
MMKTILLASLFIAAATLPSFGQDREENEGNDRSSALTPNAPRKVTMANPQKPTWQAEPHGK